MMHAIQKFTVLAIVLALMSFQWAVPRAWAAETIALRYANFPPATTFPCVQMERWKSELEKRTGGKVAVQTFPGGTLLTAKNMVDGVISGLADVGCFAMSYQPGRFPVSEAVDLPLGFTSARVSSLVLDDLIAKYQPKEFSKVKIVALFTCPPASLMTSKPVKTLADLQGMELRVSGTGADVLKRLGGTPVAMPQSDTPEAIQRGVVKGLISSLEVLKDLNYAAYCPNVNREPLNVISFAVVMNKDTWKALPADVQKAIDDLRRDQAAWTGNYVEDHVAEALAWSKEKYKLQVFDFTAGDKAKIPGLLRPMIDEYIQRVTAAGLPGEQIVKDVTTLKEKYEKEQK